MTTIIRDRPVYGRTPTLRHLAVRAHLQLVKAREEALAARVAVEEVVRVASLLGAGPTVACRAATSRNAPSALRRISSSSRVTTRRTYAWLPRTPLSWSSYLALASSGH